MILYAQIIFALNVLGLLFWHETVTTSSKDRAIGFLVITLPIYGRLFGWW